jgi:hypothetical protein
VKLVIDILYVSMTVGFAILGVKLVRELYEDRDR